MSYSLCLNCESMVPSYEKYCGKCVEELGLPQDKDWHRNNWLRNWQADRKEEVNKDLAKKPKEAQDGE